MLVYYVLGRPLGMGHGAWRGMYLIIIRLERGQFMAVLLFNARSPSLFEYYTTITGLRVSIT